MKPVIMFIQSTCPYCRQALKWMKELTDENKRYSEIQIQVVDESQQPDIANKYDYYYVPTYFVDGKKAHEGAATKDIVKDVLEKASE